MNFEDEPERADDTAVPLQARVALWLASKVTPVLAENAQEGRRLDVARDRDFIAVGVVGAVVRELVEQGNTLRLAPPPAEASAASDFNLTDLVHQLLAPPEDLEGQLHAWYTFLRSHFDQMPEDERYTWVSAHAVASTAAEYDDAEPARYHLERMKTRAEQWRDDPAWPADGSTPKNPDPGDGPAPG